MPRYPLLRVFGNLFVGLVGSVAGLWLLPLDPVFGAALILLAADAFQDAALEYSGRRPAGHLAFVDAVVEAGCAVLSVFTAVYALKMVALYNIYAYAPIFVASAAGLGSSLSDLRDSLSSWASEAFTVSSVLGPE